MKRSIALLLALIMLCLAGCVSPTPPSSSDPTTESTPPTIPSTEPSTEPSTAPSEPTIPNGMRQVTFYWNNPSGNYEKCDMWIWLPNADGKGHLFEPCEYGGKVTIQVPEDTEKVGFIVRRDCSDPGGSSWGTATKDFEEDRFVKLTQKETEVYLKYQDPIQYFSNDGGKTLQSATEVKSAMVENFTTIRYTIAPANRFADLKSFTITDGESNIEIVACSALNNNVVTGTLTLAQELDLSKQYTLSISGYGSVPLLPGKIFDSQEFMDRYHYDGNDLGATITKKGTQFKVWAPTSSQVDLLLYTEGEGGQPYQEIPMTMGDKGVYQVLTDAPSGTYYTYRVTNCLGTQEATDPYSWTVGVNGNRSMVIDLDSTDPSGWKKDKFDNEIKTYADAVIWEVHVRDFSNTIQSSAYQGKYLAFTESGLKNSAGISIGMDYVVDLGVTHVHLLPSFDYGSVDESSTAPQFNWGYDPKNYNAPEGSYATDAVNGAVRVTEFKKMVKGLHDRGLGVIMDVVYNHTYDLNACLQKIVPYYYYRFNNGVASNGSGCGNETASNRSMFSKYMVDSVCYWAKEYHVDGFRFDLMALHDVDTMQAIEQALHKINPKAIIYGEGWTGGTSALPGNQQMSQANIYKIEVSEGAAGGLAVFSDTIRDGLKGSVFDAADPGYVNGDAAGSANAVLFGLTGSWYKGVTTAWRGTSPLQVINYTSCHDNLTLWDKLKLSAPNADQQTLLAMNRLCAAAVFGAQGVPFIQAGEEMLRTKDGDHNSYASSDAVNNLKWDVLTAESDQYQMYQYYKGLIAFRKAHAALRQANFNDNWQTQILAGSAVSALFTSGKDTVLVVLNPGEDMNFTLPEGRWDLYVDGQRAGTKKLNDESLFGEITLDGLSAYIFVKAK